MCASHTVYDSAVIGGGVVGLAILRRLSQGGLKTVLLERGSDILSGASKGNSALLHTGFDAPAGSLELRCIQAGRAEYLRIRRQLNLPLLESGATMVAWNDAELAALPGIVRRAHDNGVKDVRLLSAEELRGHEPQLGAGVIGGVAIPSEHIIDPWSAPLAYAHQALAYGARILCKAAVSDGHFDAREWVLSTTHGTIHARIVVNAAGNHGDLVETIARTSPFTITPRKGQFVVFDKPASRLVQSIILPVPSEHTKGVVLFRTAFGNLAIGPTAEDQEDRENAALDSKVLKRLIERAYAIVPALKGVVVTATYAGLRPATKIKDYIIESLKDRAWITVAGIRSTGLSSALGIAQEVAQLYERDFGKLESRPPRWTPVPNLCEERPRPYQEGGEIICHCEWVTRREIEAALEGALPAGDLGGLKRRTRAMMGRCQGFYCGARIAAIAASHGMVLP